MEQISKKTEEVHMRELWLRLGVSVKITKDEELSLLCGNNNHAADALSKIVADGRAQINGNSCIPGICVEDFNKKYGTDYCADDISIQIDKLQPLSAKHKISDDDMKKIRGQLIGIVDDYLEETNVADKYAVLNFNNLGDKFIEILRNWNLI